MTHIEALKLARYALTGDGWRKTGDAIRAIDEALAQPQQEPVACGWWEHTSPVTGIKDVQDWQLTEADKASGWTEQPLYTTPPQRPWVGLSDDEAIECWPGLAMYADCAKFWENIESKLKAKNDN